MKTMKKGFTLIEMAMVLLVVGILAGIVLRNIGGQTATARDTKRMGDLRNVSNYLASYLGKYGYFPTSSNDANQSWATLEGKLKDGGIVTNLPRDPSGLNYYYYSCNETGSDAVNHFILRAILEQTQSQAPRLYENSLSDVPDNWNCSPSINDSDCSASNRAYCLAQ